MAELRTVLDYETRSRVPLELAGAITYAQHESTSIFCLGYKIDDGPEYLWIPERAPMPDDLWRAFKYGTLVAHNAGFERAITRYTLPRYPLLTAKQKGVLAHIPASRWRCTAAKAAMCAMPRGLEMAAKVLELPTQKDKHGHTLIKKYSKPRKPSKNNPKLWWDDRDDLRDIYRYCLIDVQAEYELDQALPDLSDYEQKVWELDQKINDRGILIDIPTVKIILKMIAEETGNITRGIQKLSNGTIEKATQNARMLKWLNDRGAEMSNLQAQTIRDKLVERLAPDVRQMLEYRQGGSKTSTAKYQKMIYAVGEDNRARELLLYCGATPTARWSGKRIQPHNFPRPTIKGFNSDEAIELIKSGGLEALRKKYGPAKVMDALVSAIRGMLIASEGYELFCSDFAAVEARLAFWVAGHDAGVRAFVEDQKLYEDMAATIFGMDIKDVEKESLERFIGKETILGCQYGMGPPKFVKQCHGKGKVIPLPMAKKAIYAYRKKHHPVPTAWANIERAVISVVSGRKKRVSLHKVTMYMSGNYLCIKLPSGRRLRYFKPRLSHKQLASGRMVPQVNYWAWDAKYGWVEVRAWGGIFFNHIVQGIARDLMVNGILNIDAAGYRILLSVHDEALAERKKGFGNLSEFTKLMAGNLPEWARGAPIRAEGWTGQRYRK